MEENVDTPVIPSAPELIYALTAERLADAIKAAGCSVTILSDNGIDNLRSASQGIGFQVLWGNPAAYTGEFLDCTIRCPLRIQGTTLPAGLAAQWHRTTRFARIVEHPEVVSLEMDIFVVGGVTPDYLNLSIQLWTQIMGKFFLHLRQFETADRKKVSEQASSEESQAIVATTNMTETEV
ncbi:hypothetical protein FHW67_000371 [Herbaspirillum sp. Sphag1AN]|uniref:YbjN domain-containing protein n=1 Tax=unclassified Herbaspirillum TaxID=2624150 RepID=UPI00160DC7A9|nr:MULTISPECIES: YbjN domain-containing protein [unclassified Herbaspirillum]MBB3211136.1 hypothetical protein [Herbaspirillum sp. Sphag1AN]MBB3244765.1 hypothetical protein [Herbaspirillum sp. Sphag64]